MTHVVYGRQSIDLSALVHVDFYSPVYLQTAQYGTLNRACLGCRVTAIQNLKSEPDGNQHNAPLQQVHVETLHWQCLQKLQGASPHGMMRRVEPLSPEEEQVHQHYEDRGIAHSPL